MKPQVRYFKSSDGAAIAYSVMGDGPALVFALPGPTSIELDMDLPEARAFFEGLGDQRMIVRFDMRGMGSSQREIADLSVEAQEGDLAALVDVLHLPTFDLFAGPFFPVHSAIRYCAKHPDRVRRLVLWEPEARTGRPEAPELDARLSFVRQDWRAATRLIADTLAPRASIEVKKFVTRVIRETQSPEWVATSAKMVSDVTHLLDQMSCPTLVLAARDDRQIVVQQCRTVAAAIPGAQFALIDGDSAYFFLYHDQIVPVVRQFLGDEAPDSTGVAGQGPLRAVLFTDLVGHTEMMSRLGDEKGRDVLREHERITREVLRAHGGTEVKTMGDGFMASFGSVTKAVECAVALQRAFDDRNRGVGVERLPDGTPNSDDRVAVAQPLRVRCGLNAGEPIEEDGDLFGATVILASRIAAKADGGEILVADTVRGLCSGKGFLFSDRGEFVAKGFEEPVRVYEVSWRE